MELFYTLLAFVAQLALIALVYHKLSKQIQTARHESTRNASNTISQIEGLLSLYAELRPNRGLPKTRGWAASPDFLSFLISVAQQRQPVVALECSSGVSTLVLAACARNAGRGHVCSLEHDTFYAATTRRLLTLHGLSEFATVIDAPLVPLTVGQWHGHWYDLSKLPSDVEVDMLVVDGPPWSTGQMARFPALPLLGRFLARNAVVILDDANREDERKILDRWLSDQPEFQVRHELDLEKGCVVLERKESA